jgi:hypothetical protein
VSQIKKFGQKEFGLSKTKNFTWCDFTKNDCFFVYWCSKNAVCENDSQMNEKTFFKKEAAWNFLRKKDKEGYDAFIFLAGGYIDEHTFKTGFPLTLMHFDKMTRKALARTIFHEDFHVWIKRSKLGVVSRDNEVEESMADIFGELASRYWVIQCLGTDLHRDRLRQLIYKTRIVNKTIFCLQKVYKRSDITYAKKELIKNIILKKCKKIIFKEEESVACFSAAYFYKRLNFASLYVAYKYGKYSKLFYDFFMNFGTLEDLNFRKALLKIKMIARKSKNPDDFIGRIKDFNAQHRN